MNGRYLSGRATSCIAGLSMLAAGATAHGAEWTVAPAVSWLADHASNRVLGESARASESIGASIEVPLLRRSETGELGFISRYNGRRFSDDALPDVDDVQLLTRAHHDFESARLEFNAEAARESTLTTELAETGVIRADSNRRTFAAGLGWRQAHSEERSFDASLAWQDIDYTGAARRELAGYRYATLRAGETFNLSTRGAILVTAFGSELRGLSGADREHGLSLGFSYAWSERTSMSGSLGASRRDAGSGHETGATGDFSLAHRSETLDWSVGLSHGLVPYGTGVLIERDSAQLRVTRAFGPRLSGNARAGFARNRDAGFSSGVDTRDYRFTDAELRYAFTETWSVAFAGGFRRASDENTAAADGWNVALRTQWAPRAQVIGH